MSYKLKEMHKNIEWTKGFNRDGTDYGAQSLKLMMKMTIMMIMKTYWS